MNLDRLSRVLRSRWWVLLVVALASLLVANLLSGFRADQRPATEAVSSITFLPRLGETTDEGRLTRLLDAEDLAREVNASRLAERQHPLAPWELAAIEVDARAFRIDFVGRGETVVDAIDRSEALANAYLDNEPSTGSGIQNQLDQLAAEITDLSQLIVEVTVVIPESAPGEAEFLLFAELRGLDAQIVALQAQYDVLQVELLNPIFRSSEVIRVEADQVLRRLVALQLDRQIRAAALGLNPSLGEGIQGEAEAEAATESDQAVLPFEEDTQLAFLRLQSDQLRTAYEVLFLRKIQVEEQMSVSEGAEIRPSTLDTTGPLGNQMVALVAGLLIALTGLILADRVRRPLWSSADVAAFAPLPEIERRGQLDPVDEPWYTSTGVGARKTGIQALRAAIEGVDAPVVALAGLETPTGDVQKLTADLAVSMATSGATVLLIDAALEEPADLVEFGDGLSLAALLAVDNLSTLGESYRYTLQRLSERIPGMRSLPAGRVPANAPDLLARLQFAVLLAEARGLFDVILVAGASAASPITQVLSQRIDQMLLVGTAGRTTEDQVEAVRREFSDRRARLIGITLLSSSGEPVYAWFAKVWRRIVAGSAPTDQTEVEGTLHPFPTDLAEGDEETAPQLTGADTGSDGSG
jgi:hypothetical protein